MHEWENHSTLDDDCPIIEPKKKTKGQLSAFVFKKPIIPDCCYVCSHYMGAVDVPGEPYEPPECWIGLWFPTKKKSCKRQKKEQP